MPDPLGDSSRDSAPPTEAALTLVLRRTLAGRCAVLLRALSPKARGTDAAEIIQRLSKLEDAVIRQPPVAAQRALAVARDALSSAGQLAAIFEGDPALTESLLRVANSPYYHRGGEPRVSIRKSVQALGVRGVEMVVTTKIVEGLVCRPGGAYNAFVSAAWGHMMRTAPLARTLSSAFEIPAETAFTVGLLHDVGKLIVFDYLSQLRSERRRDVVIEERCLLDLLSRLHEPLGALAALRWKLGAETAYAIACHHFEPPPEAPSPLAELLCVAEHADHAMQNGRAFEIDRFWRETGLSRDPRPVVEALRAVQGLVVRTGPGSKAA